MVSHLEIRPVSIHDGATVRVFQDLQTTRGVGGKEMCHLFAPRCGQTGFAAHAHQFRAIPVRDDQPRVCRQQVRFEISIHGPEEPVGPFEITLPFAVGHEVGSARLALDDPDITFGAERHKVDPQAARGDQFFDTGEAQRHQVTCDSPGKQLTGVLRYRWVWSVIGHGAHYEQYMNILQPGKEPLVTKPVSPILERTNKRVGTYGAAT